MTWMLGTKLGSSDRAGHGAIVSSFRGSCVDKLHGQIKNEGRDGTGRLPSGHSSILLLLDSPAGPSDYLASFLRNMRSAPLTGAELASEHRYQTTQLKKCG